MAINRLNPDYPDAGTVQITPASIAVGSGSATVTGNGSVNFNGVSSVSLNNIFDTTYDNYVIWFYTTTTSNANFQMRLRGAGSDATSVSYDRTGYTATSAGGPSSFSAQGESTAIIGAMGTLNRNSAIINLFLPYQSQYTQWTTFVPVTNNTSPYLSFYNVVGQYGIPNSYDGVTLYPASGTMTGSVSVYGLRK